MNSHKDLLVDVVKSVWSTSLGLTVESGPDPLPTSDNVFGARIADLGATEDSLLLECSMPMAEAAAARMFQLGLEDLEEADLLDAVGELANILAGNVRDLFPEWTRLGTPQVLRGVELEACLESSSSDGLHFQCEGMPFRVFLSCPTGQD